MTDRIVRTLRGVRWPGLAMAFLAATGNLDAQRWNDSRTVDLIRQATARRARQLADSGLADYQARAHGYLTFLAQLGEGFQEPPRVVKADELAIDVLWKAPNLSKQRIVGRRDTTLLPTDIAYHRDHLGIIQNNFPAIIRLGDGDEVRDVPHPLSPSGMPEYEFAISDSLRITIPGRIISVYEVKVRPVDDRLPRVIGALYLDRDEGQVVRMALSFTRAAFLDKQLEDLFVVLENGLVGTEYWLPRRQEIEIRRTATWLDYPVRAIIRGRWEISDYQLNTGVPASAFAGLEIVQAPEAVVQSYPWPSATILDSLPPDVRATTDEDVRRVQAEVRALVREQALRRRGGSILAARGISDFVHVNRVEGLAAGGGISARLGARVSGSIRGRYGFQDREPKGRMELRWGDPAQRSVWLYGERDLRDLGDVAERSGLMNSIAAQEFGSDYTNLYRVDAIGAAASTRLAGLKWTVDVGHETHQSAQVNASPATRRFRPTTSVDTMTGALRIRLVADRPTSSWYGGLEARARLEYRYLDAADRASGRVVADVELSRQVGETRVVARTIGGWAGARDGVRPQDLIWLGGPITGPGYEFHSLAGTAAVSQRMELQFPVPFPAVSLGRFGRSASAARAAPFIHGVVVDGRGLYPSLGSGLYVLFDLVRLDVARGLRNGRWLFGVDVTRAFWSVL